MCVTFKRVWQEKNAARMQQLSVVVATALGALVLTAALTPPATYALARKRL
jgi:ABC-type glycerol-3-phosphate transport system permease component